MRLIVDTQSWLWMMVDRRRFSQATQVRLERGDDDIVVSLASCWEIAIKYSVGKLPLPEPPASYLPAQLAALGMTVLPIELDHVLRVATLARRPGHGDPFDRLIIAQALALGLPVLTSDRRFAEYGVEVLAP